MLKQLIIGNFSMFTSLLSDLKVSENETVQSIIYPVLPQSKARTITPQVIDGPCNSEKSGPYRVTRPTTFWPIKLRESLSVSVSIW